MADLNPTLFEDIPEVVKLLSSDQVIIFSENAGGALTPSLVPISDFSKLLISEEPNIDALREKTKELVKQVEEAKKYLTKTFETKAESNATYVTSASLETIISKIETISDFKDTVSTKADEDCLEKQKNILLNKVKAMKNAFGESRWPGAGGHVGVGYKELVISRAWTVVKDIRKEVEKQKKTD